jgi:Xaa-Pro aminopeptidase
MELNATYNGYWGTGARMLVLGNPTTEQTLAYNKLVSLREIAKKNLTPRKKASEVYWAIKNASNDEEIELMNKLIVGYGVGVTAYEPPYLSSSDHTVLQPGMVIVFNPIVKGPKEELMMGKDTFFITPEGNRLVGWYKDWREPFIANYTF